VVLGTSHTSNISPLSSSPNRLATAALRGHRSKPSAGTALTSRRCTPGESGLGELFRRGLGPVGARLLPRPRYSGFQLNEQALGCTRHLVGYVGTRPTTGAPFGPMIW
jgi:hypothetical protein